MPRPVPSSWTCRPAPFPREERVEAALLRVAGRRPEAIAVEDSTGHRSYAQLVARGRRIAGGLARAGVRPGDRVGLLLPRSLALVEAIVGTLLAGAVYVPLDPQDPPARRDGLLRAIGARLVVSDGVSDEVEVEPCPAHSLERLAAGPALDRLPSAGGDDPAYVMFTSGSTGQPKGVLVPHRGITRLVLGNDFADLGPEQVWLHLAPPAFDASTLELWAPLLNGGRCVVVDPAAPGLDALARLVRERGVTSAWLTAALFDVVVDEAPELLAPLHQLLIGGEVLSPTHVRRALQRFPDLRLVNGYGPTENTTFTCCHRISLADTEGPIPIGRPIRNTRVYVVDEAGRPVGIGEEGELWTGGEGVALGYLGLPEQTAERFLPDPWAERPGELLYRTGDRARWRADGVLEFLGRGDGQLKLRGHRIEPGEVEAALVAHPGVKRAAVAAEDRARLVAWVVPAEPIAPPEPSELSAWLAARLPAWMVPARYTLVNDLPRGPTGKLDRTVLAASPTEATAGTDEDAPLWQELQRVLPGARPAQGFVAQGGDSLAAMVLAARWQQVTGSSVEVAEILAATDLGGLVRSVAGRRAVADAPASPAPPPEQLSLWLEERLSAEPGAYNEAFAWVLKGPLDVGRLRTALGRLVERHPALRTRLVEGPEGLRARVEAAGGWPWREEEALGEAADGAAVRERLQAEALRPFALASEPPCRALLLRLGPEEHVLQLGFHHSAVDDWGLQILHRELSDLWAGRELSVPPPAAPSAPAATAEALAWWRRSLAGASLDPGLEAPPGPVGGPTAGRVEVRIDEETMASLERRAAARGATPFVAMLGLLNLALGRLSGREPPIIGTPVSRRDGLQRQGQVGYHLQTILLRPPLVGGAGLDGLLEGARQHVLEALAHPGVGLAAQLAFVRPGATGGLSPLRVVLVVRPEGDPLLRLDGLESTALPREPGPPKFDLVVWVDRLPEGACLRVEHRRAAVSDAGAARLVEVLPALLRAVLASPEADPLAVAVPLPDGSVLAPVTSAQVARPAMPVGDADSPPPSRTDAPMVERLCRTWAEVLRRPEVGPDEDFFALGGDSLTALVLLARLRRELGIELGLAELFEAPSPRALAGRLARTGSSGPLVPPFDPDTVVLRDGGGPPVFFIGQPLLVRRLAPLLSGTRPLLGMELPAPGPDERTMTIEGLAATLRDRVQRWQPTGALTLVGYSVGGSIAFELACQLQAAGRDVATLVLLDAFAPQAVEMASPVHRARAYLGRGPAEAVRIASRGLMRRLRWAAERVAPDRRPALTAAQTFDQLLRRALRASQGWTPGRFDGDVVLVRALRPHPSFHSLRADGGWSGQIDGSVRVLEVDCDHMQLFDPPWAGAVAALLDPTLA